MGLPSIWVLVAVTVGGSMMGIVGMLIFIPLCSVLYALYGTGSICAWERRAEEQLSVRLPADRLVRKTGTRGSRSKARKLYERIIG